MKRGLYLLIITMFLFPLGLVSSQGESCFITDRASCTGTIVMGLSDTTNAHGELASEGNYNDVLCCNFAGSLTCYGQNKIIGLSSTTNAHAEIPTETTYSNEVCYSDLECISTVSICGNTSYTLSVLSLSNFTNAHIGGINDYSINICCTSASFTGTLQVYWADAIGNLISSINASVGDTTLTLVLENSGLSQGTQVNFSIWEDDNFPNPDDFIRTVIANVDSNGTVIAEWTITQEDIDRTGDYDEFFFIVNGEISAFLSITFVEGLNCNQIITCLDYTNQNFCENDNTLCQVASDSIPEDVDCSDPLIDCFCLWNVTGNACNPAFTESEDVGGVELEIGTCEYISETSDNCDDGFLSYSWIADWSGTNATKPLECIDGSRTIECPAQIQLPFFGINSFIETALIIAVIYIVLILRNRKLKLKQFSEARILFRKL